MSRKKKTVSLFWFCIFVIILLVVIIGFAFVFCLNEMIIRNNNSVKKSSYTNLVSDFKLI